MVLAPICYVKMSRNCSCKFHLRVSTLTIKVLRFQAVAELSNCKQISPQTQIKLIAVIHVFVNHFPSIGTATK